MMHSNTVNGHGFAMHHLLWSSMLNGIDSFGVVVVAAADALRFEPYQTMIEKENIHKLLHYIRANTIFMDKLKYSESRAE